MGTKQQKRRDDGMFSICLPLHTTSGLTHVSGVNNAALVTNEESAEEITTPPLTPLTLDTVLTVDKLQRLLRIVALN